MRSEFKIGDKVLLIHTGEKGLVKDFVNMRMLKVELDEEMIVPIFMDDLELYDEKKQSSKEISAEAKETFNEAELYFEKHQHDAVSGFHLSFLPVEIDDVHFFEMILVNDTNDEIRFEIKLSLQNELYMHLRNKLQRRYLYRLGDLAMDELNENPMVEITIEHASHPLFQLHKQFKLKPKTFFKDLSSTPILNQTAYNFHLGILTDNSEKINKPIEINSALTKQVQRKINENYQKPQAEKHRHFYIEDTIDLHIENLIDNHKGMTNAEIITIQLHHFKKALDVAIVYILPKFTVVHGIGKGNLKSEIWLLLKQYGAVRSFQNEYHHKFGFGATEIYFR
jgi:hypothetical protein